MLPTDLAQQVTWLSDAFRRLSGLGWRGAYCLADRRIIMFGVGPPLDAEKIDDPLIVGNGGDDDGLTARRVMSLCDRGGQLLTQAHDAGWQPSYWPFIASHNRPQYRWAAFLLTGLREMHVRQYRGDKSRCWIDDLTAVCAAACDDLLTVDCGPKGDKADTITDTQKNSRKLRPMSKAALACVRTYRKSEQQGDKIPMKQIVFDYVQENRGSVTSILRTLHDHPEEWKKRTKSGHAD